MPMQTFPDNTSPLETPVVKMEIINNGILHLVYKKTTTRTVEDMRLVMELIKQRTGNQKICILADVTNISETSPGIMNLLASELHQIARAIAITSGSDQGKMLANLFFSLNAQPFPVKMFDKETAARDWLTKHL